MLSIAATRVMPTAADYAGGIIGGILIGSLDRLSQALNPTLTLARYLPPAVIVPIGEIDGSRILEHICTSV